MLLDHAVIDIINPLEIKEIVILIEVSLDFQIVNMYLAPFVWDSAIEVEKQDRDWGILVCVQLATIVTKVPYQVTLIVGKVLIKGYSEHQDYNFVVQVNVLVYSAAVVLYRVR